MSSGQVEDSLGDSNTEVFCCLRGDYSWAVQDVALISNQDFQASNRFKGDTCIICHSSKVDGEELKLFKCKVCKKKFHHLCSSRLGNDEMSNCGTCPNHDEQGSTSSTAEQHFEKVRDRILLTATCNACGSASRSLGSHGCCTKCCRLRYKIFS